MTDKSILKEKQLTKINRMEMKGFKSFANKVEVLFQDDFNCILGPNGSGKSNVLDSLCFVLGKAGSKGLRAEKTANLIYNGGKQKKPSKTGEVHIYFDNTSGVFPIKNKELKISRVVKSTGQSDYKINDETGTRTQITDLLSHARINPDGYNIILQGDIVRLVEMSPENRRQIIEEISGISIYEDKKAKASRELDRVNEQLREADIVLAERSTYLKELKKERDQAQQFKELEEKIKRNKATILTRSKDEREKKISELDKILAEADQTITAADKKIDELKKEIIAKKKEIDDVTREVEEKGEKEQVQLNKEVEQLRVDLALKEQRVETLKTEITRIQERRKGLDTSTGSAGKQVESLKKHLITLQKKIDNRNKERGIITKKIEDYQKKNDLEGASEIDKKIDSIDKQAEKLQEEISDLRGEQQNILREKDQVEFKISTIDEKINKVLEAQKENKEQLKELKIKKTALGSTEKRLDKAIDRTSALIPELSTAKGKLETREEELNRVRARQASIQERVAGGTAIKEILKLKSKNKKIYGTVAELGNVSEKHSLALEISAGARLRSIVVEDDRTAQECIQHLKKNRLGVATFLPLNKLRTKNIPTELHRLKGTGIHGLAVDLVTYDKKYEKAFHHVLGSTIVVDNVTIARKIGIGKTRMVTVEGDLIEASGAMTGGFRGRSKGSGMGFQEKEVSNRLNTLEKEVGDYEIILARLQQEQETLTKEIDELRGDRHQLETDVLALERELHIDSADMDASKEGKDSLRAELKELDKKASDMHTSISNKNKELAKIKTERNTLREKITSSRNPQAIAELNTFTEQRGRIDIEIAEIKTEMRGLESQITNIHEPELENIKKILDQLDKEEKEFSKEQNDLKKILTSMKEELIQKEKSVEAFRKQYKALFDQRSKLESQKDKLENNALREEETIRKHEHNKNAHSVQIATLKAELAGILEEFKDYEGVEPFKKKLLEDINREIRQFERMVEDMGAVNLKALEIYEHVQSEYDNLVEKKDTLSTEREDVLLMINEIDTKKKDLFMITFDKVEKHFKRIFGDLSSKGDAFLELENPEDPFAGGLTIRVRLTGNKFMDIRSLSGGEKTMTALAFLFSIQEFEPASFYILDEVDAALDKKNSERLAKLVRSYSDNAQYVIISHNDTIISEADALFGVSMNEHGESQVTSLKI